MMRKITERVRGGEVVVVVVGRGGGVGGLFEEIHAGKNQ